METYEAIIFLRDAWIQAVLRKKQDEDGHRFGEFANAFKMGIDALADVQEGRVVPVVHGRWVKDGDFLICLNCESEINIKNSLGVENRKNYCPNCGAKMDGGKEQ